MGYIRQYYFKGNSQAPRCYKISGIVYLSGTTPQQNAVVTCFDENFNVITGSAQTTDTNGAFTFAANQAIRGDHTYHVTAQYDSGAQKYNSHSKPYIIPVEN